MKDNLGEELKFEPKDFIPYYGFVSVCKVDKSSSYKLSEIKRISYYIYSIGAMFATNLIIWKGLESLISK